MKIEDIEDIFNFGWPEGLKVCEQYTFNCNDSCKEVRDRHFSVMVSPADGDVYLTAVDNDLTKSYDQKGKFNPSPSIRCCTGLGGGRHRRTRQALLILAEAIRLDNEELGIENCQ